MSDEWLALGLVLRLRPDLQQSVRQNGSKIDTMSAEEWVSRATRMENILKPSQSVTHPKHSSNTKKNPNHKIDQGVTSKKRKFDSTKSNQGSGSNSEGSGDKSNITCYHCQKKGHYKIECPKLSDTVRAASIKESKNYPASAQPQSQGQQKG